MQGNITKISEHGDITVEYIGTGLTEDGISRLGAALFRAGANTVTQRFTASDDIDGTGKVHERHIGRCEIIGIAR